MTMLDVDELPFDRLHAEWLAHGLSTEPADFDAAEQLIADLYERVGLKVPSRFVRVASPPAGLRQLIDEGVCDPLWDQSAEDLNLTDEDTIHRWRGSCMWGQHYAPLFCYYSAMALLDVDVSAGRPHMDIGKVCGWWWGLDDLVVMVDRPSQIGAAIVFRDDWAAILNQ